MFLTFPGTLCLKGLITTGLSGAPSRGCNPKTLGSQTAYGTDAVHNADIKH